MDCENIFELIAGFLELLHSIKVDHIALLVSIFSIFISVWVALSDWKYKKIEYSDTYFLQIYKNYMLKEIPTSLLKVSFTRANKLSGEEDFIQLLQEIRRASIYYQLTDSTFYNNLKCVLQQIEDKLTLAHRKEFLLDDQKEFLGEIYSLTKELYSILDNKRSGRSRKFVIFPRK